MARRTNNEYVDMLLIYGEAHQNSAAASRLYAERFPNRIRPNPQRFTTLVIRAREFGVLQPRQGLGGGPGRHQRILDAEEEILNLAEEDPSTSTRRISGQVGVSNRIVWRSLRENQLYPFHEQKVQALQPEDHPLRVNFCRWFLRKHAEFPNFSSIVLATDEAIFTRNGINNCHNSHIWAVENPHAVRRTHFQHRFSLNVWAGLVNGQLIGPFVLPNRLDGNAYLFFLENNLQVLLEEVPLNVRQQMWFLQDGAPPHFARLVRQHLNNTFENKWIGRGGPVPWPPRSPDLNPLDFFLWGLMKTMVYTNEILDLEDLRHRVDVAARTIRQQGLGLGSYADSWIRRARLCVQQQGDNFEQLL